MIGGMKYLVAAVLVAAGAYLIYYGHRQASSIGGAAAKTGKEIANAFDGKSRQPQYVYYYAGGGALIVVGAAVGLMKRK
jgi:hypothetical protein